MEWIEGIYIRKEKHIKGKGLSGVQLADQSGVGVHLQCNRNKGNGQYWQGQENKTHCHTARQTQHDWQDKVTLAAAP